MIVRKAFVNLFVGVLVVSVVGMSGCRTAGFGKPDLSKLAFWKSAGTSKSTLPPPPARHFDPAPLEGQIAKQKFDGDQTIELNSKRFADSLNQKADSARDQIAAAAKSLNQPMRKPYSTDLDSSVADLKSKTSNRMAEYNDGLTNAQQDFKSAMAGTGGSFKDKLANATGDDWKKDFPKSPLKQASGGNSFKATNPVYDANGKLVATAQEAKNSVTDKLNQLNNSFKSKTAAATNQLAKNTEKTIDAVKSKSNELASSNQFSAPKQFTAPKQFNASTQFEAPNQFKAPATFSTTPGFQTNTHISGLNQQKTVSPPAAVSKQENLQLELVQSQVREAKLQIEALKSQLAQAEKSRVAPAPPQNMLAPTAVQPPSQSFPTQTPIQTTSPERVAQLQTPRFSNANSYPNTAFSTNPGSAPANILRNQQPSQNGFAPNNTQQYAPQKSYPTTPHGEFSNQFGSNQVPKGNFAPPGVVPEKTFSATRTQQASPASFESTGNAIVQQASTLGITKPSTGVSKIKSHISDVDIPNSVLSGSGAYAPGSVHAVGQ